jgi:hypothetical protein
MLPPHSPDLADKIVEAILRYDSEEAARLMETYCTNDSIRASTTAALLRIAQSGSLRAGTHALQVLDIVRVKPEISYDVLRGMLEVNFPPKRLLDLAAETRSKQRGACSTGPLEQLQLGVLLRLLLKTDCDQARFVAAEVATIFEGTTIGQLIVEWIAQSSRGGVRDD